MATLVSACLLGRACRYDGRSKPATPVQAWVRARVAAGEEVVAVCPEELGGLGTPRPPADLRGGDGHAVWAGEAAVSCEDGTDVTGAFQRGALRAAAALPHAREAVLKARSPSCGCGVTEIDGQRAPGDGVFAALLRQRGVQVQTDEDLSTQQEGGDGAGADRGGAAGAQLGGADGGGVLHGVGDPGLPLPR